MKLQNEWESVVIRLINIGKEIQWNYVFMECGKVNWILFMILLFLKFMME